MSEADRGKVAEGLMKAALRKIETGALGFEFERVYDARSAGGRFPARPGDFAFYAKNLHGLIEVKEVKHDYRLPSKNFKPKKFGPLNKRQKAGGTVIIAIYFSTTKLWRSPPLSYFLARAKEPSWDLNEFPSYANVEDLLASHKLSAEAIKQLR